MLPRPSINGIIAKKTFLLLVSLHNTTILGFFLKLPKALRSWGVKLSAFFVLRSTGAASRSPCRSRMTLKEELSENISASPSQESHGTGAPVRSRESGSCSRSTASKSLLTLLRFAWKMVEPILVTAIELLIAINSVNLQPCARFPSLLDFDWIFLPIKHVFSCSKVGKNKLHPFSKTSTDIFSLLNFKMSPHGQIFALLHWELKQNPGDLLVFVPWPTPQVFYHLRLFEYFSLSPPCASTG